MTRKAIVRQRLVDMFIRGVVIRTSANEVEVVADTRVTGSSLSGYESYVPWAEVLQAMDEIGALREQLSALVARLNDELLLPLLQTSDATLTLRSVSKTATSLVLTFPRASVVSQDDAHGPRKRRGALSPGAVGNLCGCAGHSAASFG